MNKSKYPTSVLLGTEEQLDSIIKIAIPLTSNGIDFGVFVNEAIDINAYYHGIPPSPQEFEDVNYFRIDDSFETYVSNQNITDDSDNEYCRELEYFHALYSNIVERIYLYTHRNIEQLVNHFGTGICFNLRYQRYIGNDLILTTT